MKPFRVTNEQLKATIICHDAGTNCPEKCPYFRSDKCGTLPAIKDYAADLLDARELIDKQESLIKEIREMISSLSSRVFDISLYPENECVAKEAEKILEKTKEYI